MLVGPHERHVAAIEIARIGVDYIDHIERHAALFCCIHQRGRIGFLIEAKQSKARTECIEQRPAIHHAGWVEIVVRGAATRDTGWGVAVDAVTRRRAVFANQW